jgi:heme-degrading monooxygenase HmoA
MHARVSTYRAGEDTDRLLQGFQDTLGPLQVVEGFSHAYFLIDKQTGNAISMTIWDDENAMNESEAGSEERRAQRTEGGGSVDSVDHFEVGLIAVAPGVKPAGRSPQPVEEPGEDMV